MTRRELKRPLSFQAGLVAGYRALVILVDSQLLVVAFSPSERLTTASGVLAVAYMRFWRRGGDPLKVAPPSFWFDLIARPVNHHLEIQHWLSVAAVER